VNIPKSLANDVALESKMNQLQEHGLEQVSSKYQDSPSRNLLAQDETPWDVSARRPQDVEITKTNKFEKYFVAELRRACGSPKNDEADLFASVIFCCGME
jgi:hypothetical protein